METDFAQQLWFFNTNKRARSCLVLALRVVSVWLMPIAVHEYREAAFTVTVIEMLSL